ncbi:MAG: phosphatidylserine decarboxylase family protein [Bdellovibrionales bacterium]|nr:phosphatidylserine decarboxylase family protein [Bdellovibrionales bacterium]
MVKVKRFAGICMDGYPFILLFVGLTSFAFYMHATIVGVAFSVLSVWCIWFFRDPERELPAGEHVLASPADGKVIEIKEVEYPYLLTGKARKISIFMNIFSVHVNRSPIEGKVIGLKYHEGKFMGAFKEKASLENEQMGVALEHHGQKILFVQIAGLIARRIICRAKMDEVLQKGERYGLIRFGSRLDLYVPLDTKIEVQVGQKVFAGKSIIGEIAWQD